MENGYDILVDNDRILDIKPEGTYKDGRLLMFEAYITPGFIDVHIPGSMDLM